MLGLQGANLRCFSFIQCVTISFFVYVSSYRLQLWKSLKIYDTQLQKNWNMKRKIWWVVPMSSKHCSPTHYENSFRMFKSSTYYRIHLVTVLVVQLTTMNQEVPWRREWGHFYSAWKRLGTNHVKMWTLIDDNVNGKRPGILDHLTLRALTVSPASPFSEYEAYKVFISSTIYFW